MSTFSNIVSGTKITFCISLTYKICFYYLNLSLMKMILIYTETVFSCQTIKLSERFGLQYKHLDDLLDEQNRIKFCRLTKRGDGQKN